ncbi:undecaprenyldiphospho-muramoylpentapeptide beta-N-acetylglucosaminyltransferase [Suttonella sp. R2A3]|uniref:undecaprenyldiphospho-muramoylpentapeptide beta-N-acetylglucosaminyltransferase n=1 Tax=Suttonella sp. R2A3 TaxID=2908648 RepID=UPI001F250DF6|nr:undecaprenyldiphospho-muramoylpentapeptide beta-N-acetylglucosaminyltransferase [Suttonella sp. R2A3]UJF24614.1 undecaprenyldiphospho-muramoylpentapeptide beta-N-acetylglucosaminyltransferase [Suttonella sp. R2A3]
MSAFSGKTILFMAGGTGGHVYPALAIAKRLSGLGATVHWLGNESGFEGQKVPDAGYQLHDIAVRGLRGNGALGWIKAPIMVSKAILKARQVIKRIQPDVVVGMGGFAAGPGGVAAKLCGVPLLIHEQNAVMGLTNRLLSRIASTVLLADIRAADQLASGKTYRVVGNPVRDVFWQQPAIDARYQERSGAIRLLVIGGSQGAKAINEVLPKALARLDAAACPQVTHQVGPRWLEAVREQYAAQQVQAEVVAFIDEMAEAMAGSDVVLSRAGALSVAEISAVGVPAIFVPLPSAVDDHQTTNASILVDQGAAKLLPQAELSAETLSQLLSTYTDRKILAAQAHKAQACAHKHSTQYIVDEIEALL